ncbi:uncharacterized protein VTP21DRAFT_11093 [Calcarisporiella thermophila]|uniref:uncharacterized protein n=1 Tax=Calcarisporiella thermophila TaxID=911321 RepID=UPI003744118A
MDRISADKQKYSSKVNDTLKGPLRDLGAQKMEMYTRNQNVRTIEQEIGRLKKEIERERDRVDELRAQLIVRRRELSDVSKRYEKELESEELQQDIRPLTAKWRQVHLMTVGLRQELVAKLVSLFDLRRVQDVRGRDAAMEYQILGMWLPSRGDFTKFPRHELNATLGHVIHFTNVLSYYLGVKLPFQVVNRGTKSYARAALAGKPSSKTPLYLNDLNSQSFMVGWAMLNYDIAYLCYTQGVEITVNRAPNTLHNLLLCCQSAKLGRNSHVTNYYHIPNQSFPLDFQQLVRVMSLRRAGSANGLTVTLHDNYFPRGENGEEEEYGELLLEDDDNAEDGEEWQLINKVQNPLVNARKSSLFPVVLVVNLGKKRPLCLLVLISNTTLCSGAHSEEVFSNRAKTVEGLGILDDVLGLESRCVCLALELFCSRTRLRSLLVSCVRNRNTCGWGDLPFPLSAVLKIKFGA